MVLFILLFTIDASALVLSAAPESRAENCSTVEDLSKGLGPVHHQADLSWCYAFTTSDLLSQKLQNQGALNYGERIHPVQVAADHKLSQSETPNRLTHSGGMVHSALSSLKEKKSLGQGLCKDTDLDPTTSTQNSLFKASSAEAMSYFSGALTKTKASGDCDVTPKNLMATGRLKAEIESVTQAAWRNELAKKCQTQIPNFKLNYFADSQRMKEIFQNPAPPASANALKTLQSGLDEALEKGSMAAISYDANFLAKSKMTGVASHSSSVVARKLGENGQCYYRIRNSWGKSCAKYSDQKNCKDGYIWVERGQLLNNTFAVEYIE